METNPISNTPPIHQTEEKPKCSGKHKTRLFIGEGNFSYTEALLNKHKVQHPELGKSIIATELLTENAFKACLGDRFSDLGDRYSEDVGDVKNITIERIEALKKRGVKVILGLDAAKMSENEELQLELKKRELQFIPRIHWNLPLGDDPKGSFFKLLRVFFNQCAALQKHGDRVYITLLQGENKVAPKNEGMAPDWIFQQGYKAKIVEVSSFIGYRLIKKRKFIEGDISRYVDYVTRNSFSGNPLGANQIKSIREFIFEKKDPLPLEKVRNNPNALKCFEDFLENEKIRVKSWNIKPKNEQPIRASYFLCDTDDESSGYSDSETEEITEKLQKTKLVELPKKSSKQEVSDDEE